MELNVMGAFNSIQAFLPFADSGAKPFNISSGIAHMSPVPTMLTYTVSKAVIIKLFDFAAIEKPDVHVVNIQPGVIGTKLSKPAGVPGQDSRTFNAHFLQSTEALTLLYVCYLDIR